MRLKPLREVDLAGPQIELFQALVAQSVRRSQKGVFDEQGAVRGPLSVLLRHPSTGRPLQQLAATLRFEGTLPDAAREAVILVVAAHWRDGHEWSSHESLGREAGMTSEQLAGLRSEAGVRFEDPCTQAACDMARAIVSRQDMSDAEYESARSVLGDEGMVEVTVLVGYYGMLSMQLRVFRVPGPAWSKS